jgi:hypothetical protein
MSASSRSPPLDLEWDRLGLPGAIAQQSHDGDSKPQQQADGHEGERYEQVEGSDGQGWPWIVCSGQNKGPDIPISII